MKEKIKLNNGMPYEIDGIYSCNNLLRIIFDKEVDIDSLLDDMSFFNTITLLTRGNEDCGAYEGYITEYLHEGNMLILSNDESVYSPITENPSSESTFLPPPLTLDEVKSIKITSLSNICNQMIEAGVDLEIDGVVEHFSYKIEDQTNIKDAFELAWQTGMAVPYHSDGNGCKLYSVEQMTSLYVAEKTNLTHHETYFNQIRAYVQSLEDKEEVEAISYGDELTGEYLENYTAIMNQAAVIIQKFLNIEGGDGDEER